MGKKDTAKRFLNNDPIRNSYLISNLEDSEIYLNDEKKPTAVVLKYEQYISMKGRKRKLIDILSEIEPGDYRFHSIDPVSFEAAKEVVEDIDDRPTWMFKRPKEEFNKPEIEADKLKGSDASVINDFWGLEGSDSTDYIKERINEGPAYGVRRDGELVAWCLTHYLTDRVICLGFLHVKKEWRRNGFAKALTEVICQDAEREDLIPVIDIFQDNEPSLSLAKNLGFVKIGENHWFNATLK